MYTDEVHCVHYQNIDYIGSFLAVHILHLLLNATMIHYAFFSVTNLLLVYGFQKNAEKFCLDEHFQIWSKLWKQVL